MAWLILPRSSLLARGRATFWLLASPASQSPGRFREPLRFLRHSDRRRNEAPPHGSFADRSWKAWSVLHPELPPQHLVPCSPTQLRPREPAILRRVWPSCACAHGPPVFYESSASTKQKSAPGCYSGYRECESA